MYEYRMVEMELGVIGSGDAAARYLENVANSNAAEGWEFCRVDPFVEYKRGCLNAITLGLLGSREERAVYVATFRRPREGGSE